ncbi:hypothetical protein VNO77_20795 [Canavalia gladiata]|uniref:Uncharacterized protein n=1 Tax=Canavalia gladiata TaxID=3824 RepID=A0AAN9QMS9_CANGL
MTCDSGTQAGNNAYTHISSIPHRIHHILGRKKKKKERKEREKAKNENLVHRDTNIPCFSATTTATIATTTSF